MATAWQPLQMPYSKPRGAFQRLNLPALLSGRRIAASPHLLYRGRISHPSAYLTSHDPHREHDDNIILVMLRLNRLQLSGVSLAHGPVGVAQAKSHPAGRDLSHGFDDHCCL
jgi:hypothetical protein